MTAIAIAQLPIGFVIAADGRMQMDAESRARASDRDRERETDDAQKIFEISDSDRTLGYVIKGTIANDDFSFDFVEEAKRQAKFLASRKFDTFIQYGSYFCSNISRKMAKAKQFEKLLPTIIFAGYFQSSHVLTVFDLFPQKSRVQFRFQNYKGCLLHGSERIMKAMYDRNFVPVSGSILKEHTQYLQP